MMDIQFHGGDENSGNIFAVETKASAGYLLESHIHSHSHMSVLVSGTAEVIIDGKTSILSGYNMVFVPANTAHSVTAITDIIWLCLWSDDLADKEQCQESLKLIQL